MGALNGEGYSDDTTSPQLFQVATKGLAMGGTVEGKEVVQESTGEQEQLPEQLKEPIMDRDHSMTLQDKRGDSIVSCNSVELSDESGALELFGLRTRGLEGPGQRQSSIDTEPHTLDTTLIRDAKNAAVDVLETYDADEALHLFLKDAEDDQIRQVAIAIIQDKNEDL